MDFHSELPKLAKKQFFMERYKIMYKMNAISSFSKNYLAYDKKEQKFVHIKQCWTQNEAEYLNEVNMLNTVYNNRYHLVDHFTKDSVHYIITNFCIHGDLFEMLLGYNNIEKSDISLTIILYNMALEVKKLHKANIVHRDIKFENFLVTNADNNEIAICDFGSAAFIGKSILHDYVGTKDYMAPEVKKRTGHSFPADIYSLGVCFKYAIEKIYDRPPRFLYELSKHMLKEDPSERPTIFDVVDEFLKYLNYNH